MAMQWLNPADHFTLMMDHEVRKGGLAGNFCGLVLELDGVPNRDEIEQRCRDFPSRFPASVASLKQTGRRYNWQLSSTRSLPFYCHDAYPRDGGEAEPDRILHDIINHNASPEEASPIAIHLIRQQDKSLFVLRWFHPACDAKGVELVLYHLFQDDTSEGFKDSASTINALLGQWALWKRIQLGLKAKRYIGSLDKQSSVLPVNDPPPSKEFNVRLVRFDEDQSRQILAEARRHSGLVGTSLYFIRCMMRALEHAGCPSEGKAYCVPYAMNLRKRKSLYPVFGNQVSFLFAQASREQLASRETLFSHLREQNKSVIKQGLDRAMLPLLQAASWLSLEKHGQIVRKSPRSQERSSFWFSFTGAMDPEPVDIAGCPVTGMFHFSPVTAPPSLGLLASQHAGRITLSYNSIANHFTDDWLDTMMQAMSAELLGDL